MSPLPPQYADAAYLRVASMAVGAYELICTLPAEYRFYRQQVVHRSLSQQCALFILIRYLSIVVVVVSNVGFFGRFFSIDECRRFMLVSPIFKALQTLVSQLILASRTYSISRKSRWVLWTMLGTFLLTVPMQFFSNVYRRTPVHDSTANNCTSGNTTSYRIAWVHYIDAMFFDVVVICISTGYLWVYSSTTTRISYFVRSLLYEGLGYFVVLTGANIFNLVLYLKESEATQSSGASLGYVIIFIMSQRILIRQREYADKYASSVLPSNSCKVSLSHRLDSTREINDALRSQFESGFGDWVGSKASADRSWSPTRQPSLHSMSGSRAPQVQRVGIDPIDEAQHNPGSESELDVRVRVERTVTIRRIPSAVALGRENYKKPRVMWEQ